MRLTKKAAEIYAVITVFLSLICIGCFYEYLSSAVSVLLLIGIILFLIANKKLYFICTALSVCAVLFPFFYLICSIWAIDKATAVLGFVKYLPVGLAALLFMQSKEIKNKIILLLPYFGAAVTLGGILLGLIPAFTDYFYVADRFGGMFQYPNTYGVFLLCCAIIFFNNRKYKWYGILSLAVLVFGIFYTGSRTVFVLTAAAFAVLIILNSDKKIRLISFLVLAAVTVFVVFISLVFKNTVFSRLVNISLTDSTFAGRFLYFSDALPVILKHPFGIGYLGYYLAQPSFQTGVYSVMFMHNDLLQFVLDIGIFPVCFCVFAVIKSLIKGENTKMVKTASLVIIAHSLFDFDLEFAGIFILLILLLSDNRKEAFCINNAGVVSLSAAALCTVCVFFGTVTGLYRFNKLEAVQKLYPHYTLNNIKLLALADSTESLDNISEIIINDNKYVSVAYSAKAKCAYSKGKFADVIKYKQKVFELSPFVYEEYEDYCNMLIIGIKLYAENNDYASVQKCQSELISAKEKLQNLPNKQSKLGKMIKDQPTLSLPKEISEYIESLENQYENKN